MRVRLAILVKSGIMGCRFKANQCAGAIYVSLSHALSEKQWMKAFVARFDLGVQSAYSVQVSANDHNVGRIRANAPSPEDGFAVASCCGVKTCNVAAARCPTYRKASCTSQAGISPAPASSLPRSKSPFYPGRNRSPQLHRPGIGKIDRSDPAPRRTWDQICWHRFSATSPGVPGRLSVAA